MTNDRQRIELVEIRCDKCKCWTKHRKYDGDGFVCLICGEINVFPYQDNSLLGCDNDDE